MTAAVTEAVQNFRRDRPPALRVYEYLLLRYKKTWRGTLTESFLYPLLYLLAMGIGLGHLVNQHLGLQATARFGGVTYVAFIAPGLLAATAMQLAVGESCYPVLGGIRWDKTYYAMLATPVRVQDIVTGHLLWVGTRVAASSAIFLAIVAAFGDVTSGLAIFAVPAATLTGLAFAAPCAAFAATRETDNAFSLLYRIGIIPLFLFSGTFFPISQLPGWLQVIARLTPLYHGVALCRGLMLGQFGGAAAALAHVAYLVAMAVAGTLWARRSFRRRLAQ